MKKSNNLYIRDVIDNVLALRSDDGYLRNIKRYQAVGYAKRFLQELSFIGGSESVKVWETEIPPSGIIEPPIDYVDYVRLSIVDSRGWLLPLFVNYDKNISYEYLKDNTGEVVYDNQGLPLKATGTRESDATSQYYFYSDWNENRYDYVRGNEKPGMKGGYVSTTGEYRYDEEGGVFWLQRVPAEKVVLEYIADPLLVETPEDLTIHKMWVEPLEYWIFWKYIEHLRPEIVPLYEKQKAKQDFWHSFKLARRKSGTKIAEIIQYINRKNSFFKW